MNPFDRIWEPIDDTTGEPIEWPSRWRVHHTVETGSTNTDLLTAHAQGIAADRTALVTDHQTAGRGRLDRRWDAPPGANLLVSLLFTDVPDPAVELTQRVGLAAVHAAAGFRGGADLSLKWPNDVMLGEQKLAGILAQRSSGGVAGRDDAVVVGMGLNLAWAPEGAARLGDDIAPPAFLAALLERFEGLPDEIGSPYRAAVSTLGRPVRIELPDGSTLEGTAEAVDDAGRLVVRDAEGVRRHLDVGDVVHTRVRAG